MIATISLCEVEYINHMWSVLVKRVFAQTLTPGARIMGYWASEAYDDKEG